MTKQQAISMQILAKMAGGMSVLDAMREVLGSKLVDQMIDDLYARLRGEVA